MDHQLTTNSTPTDWDEVIYYLGIIHIFAMTANIIFMIRRINRMNPDDAEPIDDNTKILTKLNRIEIAIRRSEANICHKLSLVELSLDSRLIDHGINNTLHSLSNKIDRKFEITYIKMDTIKSKLA